jgi:methionyl-tRNA synthetase
MFTDSKILDWRRIRTSRSDLDWGIDVPVEGAKKNIRLVWCSLDISRLQKNGRYVKEKNGTYWKDQDTSWFIL